LFYLRLWNVFFLFFFYHNRIKGEISDKTSGKTAQPELQFLKIDIVVLLLVFVVVFFSGSKWKKGEIPATCSGNSLQPE